MDPNFSNRNTFDRYLYDYLIKKNMHQTAEILRIEANLQLSPDDDSSTIDEPKGVLLEWWSLNLESQCFRDRLQLNAFCTAIEVPSTEEPMLDTTQKLNASDEAECCLNTEATCPIPDNSVPIFSTRSDSMPSHEIGETPLLYLPSSLREVYGKYSQLMSPLLDQEVSGHTPLLVLPSSHQEDLLTPRPRPVNINNTSGQGVDFFGLNAPRPENTAVNTSFVEEMDPVVENLLNSIGLFEPDQMDLFNSQF